MQWSADVPKICNADIVGVTLCLNIFISDYIVNLNVYQNVNISEQLYCFIGCQFKETGLQAVML